MEDVSAFSSVVHDYCELKLVVVEFLLFTFNDYFNICKDKHRYASLIQMNIFCLQSRYGKVIRSFGMDTQSWLFSMSFMLQND